MNRAATQLRKHSVPLKRPNSTTKEVTPMAKSSGNRPSGNRGGGNAGSARVANLPSKTGKPYGPRRGNAPPRGGKGK